MSGDPGVFATLVADAGALIAASGAIALGWRGRARWEPSETDIPKPPQQVAGLISAVLIAVCWATLRTPSDFLLARTLTLILAFLTILSLCIYGYLVALKTYQREVMIGKDVELQAVIGGFSLTPGVKQVLQENNSLTIQEAFKGAAYDADRVWTRESRALAKMTFVLAYMALTVCGTIALACAAILVRLVLM